MCLMGRRRRSGRRRRERRQGWGSGLLVVGKEGVSPEGGEVALELEEEVEEVGVQEYGGWVTAEDQVEVVLLT